MISTSITIAKYIAFGYISRKIVQIQKLINKIELDIMESIIMHGDNKMSIILTKNMESQYQIKYIDVQYHYICEFVNKEEIIIKQISSTKILANSIIKTIFTKIFRKNYTILLNIFLN